MMPSTNGNHPKRAILYTRVSGDKQRDHGYSLSDQQRELREWAEEEGYEVLEEVEDGAWSGGFLERPGLDQVRERVAAGGVDAVVVLFRDRIARGIQAQLLSEELAEHGCKLIALNAQVDDSPEGELHGGMLDLIAGWERKKIAERTRRGRAQKAREGKIVAGRLPNYGFKYNEARDSYLVDEEQIRVVRRMFYMLGVEAKPLNAVRLTLQREGIVSPTGSKTWAPKSLRGWVLSDLYRPHTYSEIVPLVSESVAARLDPDKRYGIWWFNRHRAKLRQVVEHDGDGGRGYKKRQRVSDNPREEWIAVPVPDSGIPVEWIDAARASIKDNRRSSSAGDRLWELSGGILFCAGCGRRMVANRVLYNGTKPAYYYRCPTRQQRGQEACPTSRHQRADKLEPLVWACVRDLLTDPERLRRGFDKLIEEERRLFDRASEGEARRLREKLEEIANKRVLAQDLALDGLLTREELRTKLSELDEAKEVMEKELEACVQRVEVIKALEEDRDATLAAFAESVPEDLDYLAPEERHRVYKMLRLRVEVDGQGPPVITAPLTIGEPVCKNGASPTWSPGRRAGPTS